MFFEDSSEIRQFQTALQPNLQETMDVKSGEFSGQFTGQFTDDDRTYTLITWLHHIMIKTTYSNISSADIVESCTWTLWRGGC